MTQRGPIPSTPPTDDLLLRAQSGAADAVGALFDENYDAILRYLWARLGDLAAAQDLTGEVFLRMVRALPQYRPNVTPVRAWLYRIAHNLLVDYLRRHNRQATLPLHALDAHAPAQDHVAAQTEHQHELERMRHALQHLDETQREVVTLRFIAGLSLRDTAAALDKTEAAIKALQHRGLAALRHALTESELP